MKDGFFYAIQLAPDAAPLRVKFGWTRDPRRRLSAHRCAAPTATLIKSWPCLLEWERPASSAIVGNDCARLSGEVFDVSDIGMIVERADDFFVVPRHAHERQVGEVARPAPDGYLTPEQAADYMQMSRATFWTLAKRHALPRYKTPLSGKRIFFKPADLDTLRRPYRVGTTPGPRPDH